MNYLLTQNGETELRLYQAGRDRVSFCDTTQFFSRICWVENVKNLVVVLLADLTLRLFIVDQDALKQVSELSLATLQPVIGKLIERNPAVHMQHTETQLAFFFADSNNVLVASMQDDCLLDAELDTVDGFERAVDVVSIGSQLCFIGSKPINSDRLYSHDPMRLEIVNEQQESDNDETLDKTNVLFIFSLKPNEDSSCFSLIRETSGQLFYKFIKV